MTAAPSHNDLANAIRALAMDAVQAAKSGHPGMPMGMADVATVLFGQYLKFDPRAPEWPDRDRFVHSVGHGSMMLYAVLHLTGYEDMTIDEIKNFRQLGSKTAGHPEYGHAKGIETTTGPLGQGIGNAVGMALAERHLRARFGPDLVDHRTWVMAGDGCMQEGIGHEAASLAGHQKLDRLTIFYDDNSVSIDGPTSLSFSDDTCKRYEAYGWHTQRIDGHDPQAIAAAIEAALADDRPSLIACRTTIGYGAPNKGGTAAVHGAPLGEDEVAAAREYLGWTAGPFVIPDPIQAGWREIGQRSHMVREAWQERLKAAPDAVREAFARGQAGTLPADLDSALASHKAKLAAERPSVASRKSSQDVLEFLTPMIEEMIGGSADLTGSNNTKTKVLEPITPETPGARYMYYGVREHGMVAAMNGIALHGGLIPYGGTFLVFSDYCRPSIRLASLMGIRVVLVMTHDSIGLGEDGPTHQPVEHLASLRALPGLWVMRPADAIEVAECWVLALGRKDGPSLMALSRQNLPTVRFDTAENMSAKGAYVLAEASGSRQVTILSTGSEVKIALEARTALEGEGIATAVVSMPCWELFEQQDASYREAVLGSAPRIAVEAASPFGWTRYVASEQDVVGMTTFGASGPLDAVYTHFGITAEAVVARARAHL